MHDSDIPQREKLAKQLQHLQQMVNAAQSLLNQGQTVNLDGLDRQVEQLCRDILALPGEMGQELIPDLQKLGEDFTVLGAMLAQEQSEVARELNELTKRRQASRAYSRAVSEPPPNKKEDTQD